MIRPDWSKREPVVYSEEPKRNIDGHMRKDWNRNESGQWITRSEGDLRQQWDREGGFEQNRDRVLASEQAIVSLSENPAALQDAINELPKDIAMLAADHMRLTPGYGPDAGARRFEQFLDALSPSQFETFHKWWRGLPRGDQDAILAGISL